MCVQQIALYLGIRFLQANYLKLNSVKGIVRTKMKIPLCLSNLFDFLLQNTKEDFF